MSEATLCNYCLLQEIKKQNEGKEVKVEKSGDYQLCNLQVFIDGVGIGVWFSALSDHCVC